jgi:FAD/FMN-containing dehydrogenase
VAAPAVSDRAWKHLALAIKGPLLRPGDSGFKGAARPNNLVYDDRVPAGIARCRTDEDVSAAILWCRENDARFAIRAGGYNYAGHSTTRGLLIDVSGLDKVAFNAKSGRVSVGAGVTNRELYKELSGLGVAVVHGRVYGLGVGGFTLGGGVGYDTRLHGVGCDKLVESHVVGADGEMRVASADENADLFWACRGGAGGNFGINTRFVLETFAVEDITTFDITWSRKPEAVMAALITALENAPRRMGSKMRLHTVTPAERRAGADVRVNLTGQLHGRRAELLDILAPVFAVAPAMKETIRTGPYWECQKLLAEERKPEHYRGHSRFVADSFGNKAIDAAFRQARRFPGTGGRASLKLFQTGGAVNDTPTRETAFVHRSSKWLFMTTFTFKDSDDRKQVAAASDWLEETYETMVPFCGEGGFQNVADPALKDWARQYYGANLARLRDIKAAIDPDNVFRFAQSIRPAG